MNVYVFFLFDKINILIIIIIRIFFIFAIILFNRKLKFSFEWKYRVIIHNNANSLLSNEARREYIKRFSLGQYSTEFQLCSTFREITRTIRCSPSWNSNHITIIGCCTFSLPSIFFNIYILILELQEFKNIVFSTWII